MDPYYLPSSFGFPKCPPKNFSIFPNHKQIVYADMPNEIPCWMPKRVYDYVSPRQQLYDGSFMVDSIIYRNPNQSGAFGYKPFMTTEQIRKMRVDVVNKGINDSINMNKMQLDLAQPNLHQVRPLGPTFQKSY
jgi:hypothetical protein